VVRLKGSNRYAQLISGDIINFSVMSNIDQRRNTGSAMLPLITVPRHRHHTVTERSVMLPPNAGKHHAHDAVGRTRQSR